MSIEGEKRYPLNIRRVLRDIFGSKSIFYLSDNNVWIPSDLSDFEVDLVANYDFICSSDSKLVMDSVELLDWFSQTSPQKYEKLIKQYRQALTSHNLFFKNEKHRNSYGYDQEHVFFSQNLEKRNNDKDLISFRKTLKRSCQEIDYYKKTQNYFVSDEYVCYKPSDIFSVEDEYYDELTEELQGLYHSKLHLTNLFARLYGNEFMKPKLLSLRSVDLESCMFHHDESQKSAKVVYLRDGSWPSVFRCLGCGFPPSQLDKIISYKVYKHGNFTEEKIRADNFAYTLFD